MAPPTKPTYHINLPVAGMTCAECPTQIEAAVGKIPGVQDVQVLVGAERATVTFDPDRVTVDQIKGAINETGYTVPERTSVEPEAARRDVGQIIGWGVLGMVAAVVLVACAGYQLHPALSQHAHWVRQPIDNRGAGHLTVERQ